MSRLADVQRFYHLLDELEAQLGGKRLLSEAHGRMDWPQRGVYFFFEEGERRGTSGTGPRVVRVGTHAVSQGSKTTLWHRLRGHKGTGAGSGNHRGSIFRLHVGTALMERDGLSYPTWGTGRSAKADIRLVEAPLEAQVSTYIGRIPVLWLDVDDAPSALSLRASIERHAIALLSNAQGPTEPIDPPSETWLGRWAKSEAVRQSGLWNINHTTASYDPDFLDVVQHLVRQS